MRRQRNVNVQYTKAERGGDRCERQLRRRITAEEASETIKVSRRETE